MGNDCLSMTDNRRSDESKDSKLWSWVLLFIGFYMMYMVATGLMTGEVLAIGAKNMSPAYVAEDKRPVFYWVSIVMYAVTSVWLIYSTFIKIKKRNRAG